MGRLNSAIVAPVDEQKTVALFEQEGYYVDKADEKDFRELENELDKLLTIDDTSMNEQNAKRTAENRTDQVRCKLKNVQKCYSCIEKSISAFYKTKKQ